MLTLNIDKNFLKYTRYIIVVFLVLFGGSVFSQINEFADLFDSGTNAIINNPANLVNSAGFEISIAPIANSQLDITLPFPTAIIFLKNNEKKNIVDLPSIYKRAKINNYVYLATNFNLFYFSVKGKKMNWNFYIGDRIISSLNFQYSFLELLNLGNKAFIGENFEYSSPINEIHYRHYSVSLAKALNNRIDFGIAGNLYFGKSMIKVNPNFSLFTQKDIEYIEFTISGKGNTSLPVNYFNSENGFQSGFSSAFYTSNYFFGFDNPGLGVDIGINYKVNNQISLSASATDVGFIYWNSNIKNLSIDGTYNWNGVDVSDIVDFGNVSSIVESITTIEFQDSSINRLIEFKEESIISFTPLNLNFSVAYNYSKKITLVLQNHLQFYVPFVRETFSASGSYLLNEKWMLMAGVSFKNRSYFNIPAGFAFKNNSLIASFKLSNLWGVFIPSLSTSFGGGINMTYRFNLGYNKYYESDIHYPFYKRLDKKVKGKRFY